MAVSKALVLWTGGVESTSVLKWLLEDTSMEVHAHHIRMKNMEFRSWFEIDAIERLRPKLRDIRHFEFSQSSVAICAGQVTPPDHWTYLPIAASVMRHHNCDRIYRGWCVEDNWTRIVKADGTPEIVPPFPGVYMAKWFATLNVLRPFVDRDLEDVCPITPLHHWPKARHVENLGLLFYDTWSCRKPINGGPCFKCFSCLSREAAASGTSAVSEVADQIRVQGMPE